MRADGIFPEAGRRFLLSVSLFGRPCPAAPAGHGLEKPKVSTASLSLHSALPRSNQEDLESWLVILGKGTGGRGKGRRENGSARGEGGREGRSGEMMMGKRRGRGKVGGGDGWRCISSSTYSINQSVTHSLTHTHHSLTHAIASSKPVAQSSPYLYPFVEVVSQRVFPTCRCNLCTYFQKSQNELYPCPGTYRTGYSCSYSYSYGGTCSSALFHLLGSFFYPTWHLYRSSRESPYI
jgi:hypothetical protein